MSAHSLRPMSNIEAVTAERLASVQQTIAEAEKQAGRAAGAVTLVAVSKTFPADDIRSVLDAGQRVFGENRVQEAHGKWPDLLEQYAKVELHLIGPLQSNKVGEAVSLFDVIETLDREKLARALVVERDKGHTLPDLFVQVNTGAEPQKAGILPQEADAFIAHCRDELGLPVVGLMCIPPVDEEPALHFALLEKIAVRNGLSLLSMGMSSDFETAIEFGATHVRVGSAIFGARTPT
ncbi:YggS family pyridoxal phosphate-dependent enzyme [Parvibaculaceae bacterium PLY_AMNH_Bact1]|nr:YggS family pyridoxal phosphate-dependent enzyme [Parvibaculaceae bacterium PLY_AMNH_Bact1]